MGKERVVEPWFVTNPAMLEEVRESLRTRFPTMYAFVEGDRVVVRGTLPVKDGDRVLDRYRIEAELAPDHPRSPPVVREVGYRIPRVPDRHVNPGGSLCLGVPEEVWGHVGRGVDISNFLDGPVRSFLIGSSLVERGEAWPGGEWSHGVDGICEFYERQIGIKGRAAVHRLLKCLAKREMKGHWPCPCGSGAKLRRCHMQEVLELRRRLPLKGIRESLRQFAAD